MNTFSTFDYISYQERPRSKIFLPQNLVSLLEEGEKVVYYADSKTTITRNQFAILSSGNCLMTEKLPGNNNYHSTMLFFDNTALNDFFVKYASVINELSPKPNKKNRPFVVFEKDQFIRNFVASLKLIQAKPTAFSERLIKLKFEELMLYLLELYPEEIISFNTRNMEGYPDLQIRRAVELNIINNLTIDELAFICNISVSTFKRKFGKIYKLTPSQYFIQQKMEMAKLLLLQNENPGEVFYKVGYENHSSFSQSFKRVEGISPKEFQQRNLTVFKQLLND
jgi:AraC-like DNA-binding protein